MQLSIVMPVDPVVISQNMAENRIRLACQVTISVPLVGSKLPLVLL
jgi:hypothetical protein